MSALAKSSLVALLLASLASGVPAQEAGRIEGRVTTANGAGIPGVVVTIEELGRATHSGADGEFAFAAVPAGTYTLGFVSDEHSSSTAGVEVTGGATTRLDQPVDWSVSFAEMITVTSASRRVERITEAPAAVTVIDPIQIAREAAHGQLPKLLEFTPGAEVTQSGVYDYNFNTRGFNSTLNRRVATVIDGRDPSVPFLGSQEWAAVSFPLDDLDTVEFVRGPSAALYGANASSGVLNLVTKAPRDSQGGVLRLVAGELSTLNADFRLAGGFGESDWYYKVLGGVRTSGDFTVSRVGAAEYSVPCPLPQGTATDCLPQEVARLDPEDDDQIVFGGVRLDRYFGDGAQLLTLEAGTATVEGPVFQTGIGRVQVQDVDRPWARASFGAERFNLLATYNRRQADRQRALASGRNVALDDENWGVELQTNFQFAQERVRLVAGGAYGEEDIDSADPDTGRQTLVYQPVSSDASALFAQLDWDVTDRLRLVLAGRYDESSLHDSQFSPKGSVVFAFTPAHSLRLTYNEAFQVANYSEFFLQADVATPVDLSALNAFCAPFGVACGFGPTRVLALGNDSLEVEEIRTLEAGYTGILGEDVLLTIDYYRSENENFITDLLPNVGTALGRLNSDFGPWEGPAGLPDAIEAAIRGLVPLLSNNFDGSNILAARTYTNFGSVDTEGVDLGFTWQIDPRWQLAANYSWFDFELQASSPGLDQLLLPNTPENKWGAGVSYNGERWGAGLSYRWVDDFRWVVGPFQGDVDSYSSVDLSADFEISNHWTVGATIANLLDDEHWEAFGGDLIGRRALGQVTLSW